MIVRARVLVIGEFRGAKRGLKIATAQYIRSAYVSRNIWE